MTTATQLEATSALFKAAAASASEYFISSINIRLQVESSLGLPSLGAFAHSAWSSHSLPWRLEAGLLDGLLLQFLGYLVVC